MSLSTIRVDVTGAAYDVVIGAGACAEIGAALHGADRVACLADRRVVALHGPLGGRELAEAETLALDGGEDIKTFAVLEQALAFCAAARLSRASVLVAYGGGTLGDLGGLTASLFKRGIDVIQVPTTLLAQVDASVGGKTAINVPAGKNLVGTLHQPRAVFCDVSLLATLPDAEYASGLGEVVKTAIIGGDDVLVRIEELVDGIAARDVDALTEVVSACVRVKADIVAADPGEHGQRRVLNLGHTFAHAIEHAAGYGTVPHGIAVGVGLALAARAAEEVLNCDPAVTARTLRLLERFGLSTSLDTLRSRDGLAAVLTPAALHAGLGHDKKGRVGAPEFVLARAPGDVVHGVELDAALVEALLR